MSSLYCKEARNLAIFHKVKRFKFSKSSEIPRKRGAVSWQKDKQCLEKQILNFFFWAFRWVPRLKCQKIKKVEREYTVPKLAKKKNQKTANKSYLFGPSSLTCVFNVICNQIPHIITTTSAERKTYISFFRVFSILKKSISKVSQKT